MHRGAWLDVVRIGRWQFTARSIAGAQRRDQQDAYCIVPDPAAPGAAVFDGAGGYPNGRQAAMAARSAFLASASKHPGQLLHALKGAVEESGGMTTVAGFVGDDDATVITCGDSAIFRWRGGSLESIGRRDERAGRPTDLLGKAGAQGHLDVISLEPGDTLLLCTDGVTRLVDVEALAKALADPPKVAVARILHAVEQAGARDNATALIARRV